MTGDPTERLPCSGMVDEIDRAIAETDEMHARHRAMLVRRRDAIVSCEGNCWVRNPNAAKAPT